MEFLFICKINLKIVESCLTIAWGVPNFVLKLCLLFYINSNMGDNKTIPAFRLKICSAKLTDYKNVINGTPSNDKLFHSLISQTCGVL